MPSSTLVSSLPMDRRLQPALERHAAGSFMRRGRGLFAGLCFGLFFTSSLHAQTPDAFNPDANGTVYALATQADGKILMGGNFTTVGGVTRNRIARVNPDGSLDASFDANASGLVTCLAVQADGKIVMGGDFTTVAGVTRNRIARLNADGSLDTGFNPNVGGGFAIASVVLLKDGKMLLGGSFNTVGGASRNYIARLNADGSLDSGFAPILNGQVISLVVQVDGKILMGGLFTTVGGVARNRLARLNADGSLDTSFNPGTDSIPQCFAMQTDGKVLVGGSFTTMGGVARNRIARLNVDGMLDSSFNPNASDTVFSLVLQTDGKILMGGSFTIVGGVTRNRIARLNADGTLDGSFNPDANGYLGVNAPLVQADGRILIGGDFTTVGGVARNRIARLTNQPASSSLIVAGTSLIDWVRGGTAPEVEQVVFESWSGSAWVGLGTASRVSGGWQLNGLALPASGSIRARARTIGGQYNGSSGIIEQTTAYSNEVNVVVTPAWVAEDGAGTLTYTFTRAGNTSGAVLVNFTVGGTATYGTDYTVSGAASFTAGSGTIMIPAGAASAVLSINAVADSTVEVAESVDITVTAGTGFALGSVVVASGIIADDDAEVSVSLSPTSVPEDGPANLLYTFTRSGDPSLPLTVEYALGGTASSVLDYGLTGVGAAVFVAGSSTATVEVNPKPDADTEGDETVVLTVRPGMAWRVGSPSSATGTIAEDETPNTPGRLQWVRTSLSSASSSADTRALWVDGSDNTYAVGRFVGTVDFFGTTLSATSTSIPSGWAAKFAPDGTPLWVRKLATDNFTELHAVCQFGNGEILVGGSASGSLSDGATGFTIPSASGQNTFLARLDSATGNTLWAHHAGGTGTDTVVGMAKTPGGQIALLGTFNNSIDFGGATLNTFGGIDSFTVRVTNNGTFLNPRNYGSVNSDSAGGIMVDSLDRITLGFLMTGTTGNYDIGTAIPCVPNSIIFAQYTEGSTAPSWHKVFTNTTTLRLNKAVAVAARDEILGYGFYSGSPNLGGSVSLPTPSGVSGYIVKMDQDGNHLWQKQIGDGPLAAGDQVTHMAASRTGYIGVIGISRSTSMTVDDITLTHSNNNQQAYYLILDANGAALWGKKLNGSAGGNGYHVASCSNNDLVFGGVTSAADFGNGITIPTGSLNREAFIARYRGFPYPEISAERNGIAITSYHFTAPENLGSAVVGTTASHVTITLRNDGTADLTGITPALGGTSPDDFILDASATATTLTPGATTTFSVQFSPTAIGERNASVTIASNDYDESPFVVALTGTGLPPEVTLAVSPSSVAEDGATNLSYTFTRNGPTTAPLTVNFTTSGTADAASDYVLTGADSFSAGMGTVTIPIGSASATVTLDPSADPVLEADETAMLTVTSGSGYSVGTPAEATGTIVNDDTEVSLAVAPATLAEDAPGTLAFTLTRNGPLGVPLTVNLTVSGSAGFGGDYTQSGAASFTASTATVTFAAGSTTAVVDIDPTADTTVEADESVSLTIAPGTGYLAVNPNSATATLVNDDTDVSVAVSPASVLEDGATNLVFTFTRVGVTSGSLTANFSVGGTATGSDYSVSGAASISPTSGTVSFAPGATTKTVTIDPTADQTDATDETVTFTVTPGSGYTPGIPSAATGTILNDDIPQEIAVEQPSGTGLTSGVSSGNFGSVVTGSSKTRTFTIRNLGTVPLTGVSVGKSGTHSGDFAVTQPATTVNGGGSTTFTVTFTPTASGARNATLSIASNDADENPFKITLSGTGGTSQQLLADAMAAAGLSGTNAQPGATPYNDGVSNLLKYAFNMNLAGPDRRTLVPGTGTVGLPVMRIVSGTVRYEFLRRKNSGLIYTPQQSSNLSGSGWQAASGTTTVTSIDENWERVEIQQAPGTARFFRVVVAVP